MALYVKQKADITFLKFYSSTQLLPNFTNFELSAVTFKKRVLKRSIDRTQKDFEAATEKLTQRVTMNFYEGTPRFKFYLSLFSWRRSSPSMNQTSYVGMKPSYESCIMVMSSSPNKVTSWLTCKIILSIRMSKKF